MHRALVLAVLEAPGDAVSRAALADWLEDHGKLRKAAIVRGGVLARRWRDWLADGPALCCTVPPAGLRIRGRKPAANGTPKWEWSTIDPLDQVMTDALPGPWFEMLAGINLGSTRDYHLRRHAYADLHRAALAWAMETARLVLLVEPVLTDEVVQRLADRLDGLPVTA